MPRTGLVYLFKEDSRITYNSIYAFQSIGYQFDYLTIFRRNIKWKLYTIVFCFTVTETRIIVFMPKQDSCSITKCGCSFMCFFK